MSTSTWNPERRFPWLGDSLPCPTPEELADLAAEDRAATVRLYGLEHVEELEREASK